MTRDYPSDDEFDPATAPPSKGMRKRAAHAAQALGEQLIALREPDLVALDLPENLLEAIRLARRITARGGLARQRQYIGKLMRDIDPAPIEAALAARDAPDAGESARFRQLEQWRTRLLAEGDTALEDWLTSRPGLERTRLAPLLARARAAREDGERASTSRALFREMRRQVEVLEAAAARAARAAAESAEAAD
jgi:ribosome-associated protein